VYWAQDSLGDSGTRPRGGLRGAKRTEESSALPESREGNSWRIDENTVWWNYAVVPIVGPLLGAALAGDLCSSSALLVILHAMSSEPKRAQIIGQAMLDLEPTYLCSFVRSKCLWLNRTALEYGA